jgi:hypothetical protein
MRMRSFSFVSGLDFSQAVEAQEIFGLYRLRKKSILEKR